MKNNILTLASAAILGLAFTTTNNIALAETVVKETTTTTTAGTISEFGADTIIVRSATSPAPIQRGSCDGSLSQHPPSTTKWKHTPS